MSMEKTTQGGYATEATLATVASQVGGAAAPLAGTPSDYTTSLAGVKRKDDETTISEPDGTVTLPTVDSIGRIKTQARTEAAVSAASLPSRVQALAAWNGATLEALLAHLDGRLEVRLYAAEGGAINATDGQSISIAWSQLSATFTGTTTAGTNFMQYPVSQWSMAVKGTGAAATSWTVLLEGSLDGTNFTTILTHTNITGDGILLPLTTPFVARYWRLRCSALVLGGASNIVATVAGVQ